MTFRKAMATPRRARQVARNLSWNGAIAVAVQNVVIVDGNGLKERVYNALVVNSWKMQKED